MKVDIPWGVCVSAASLGFSYISLLIDMFLGSIIMLRVRVLIVIGLVLKEVAVKFWLFKSVGIKVEGGIYLNKLFLAFLFMLGVCSFLVFIYCFHYFGKKYEGKMLFYLILWFVRVMCCLIRTKRLILSLVFWDYLGFVSYLLILYYGSLRSFRSSVITMISSRIGDVAFYCLVVLLLFEGGLRKGFLFIVVFPLIVLRKSASYPFVSWLLEAMRAPTPVSALVHSSTLVAAGVWFFSRYRSELEAEDEIIYVIISISSLISIFTRGICALFYRDLKKIVALSTCNKMSWCLVFIVLGDEDLAVYQLISHGICKCLLFILVGDVMSSRKSSQSYLMIYPGILGYLRRYILVFVLTLGLRGLPFLGIYYTKHLFFSRMVLGCTKWILCCVILLGFSLSCAYSFRLCLMIYVGGTNVLGYISRFKAIVYLCCVYRLVNCILFYCCNELGVLGVLSSLVLLFFQAAGLIVGGLIYSGLLLKGCFSSFWLRGLFGRDWVVNLVFSKSEIIRALLPLGIFQWESRLRSYLKVMFGKLGKNGLYYGGGIMRIGFLFVMCLVWFVILWCV